MTSFAELTEDDVLDIARACGEPGWLTDVRLEAFKAFSDMPWPTSRDEEWRYTNPKRFDLGREIVTGSGVADSLTSGVTSAVAGQRAAAVRIVDGRVVQAAVSESAAAQGVIATDLVTAARDHEALVRRHFASVVGAGSKFEALSLAAFTESAFVYVPADVELAAPITVTVQVTQPGAIAPRVLLVVGRHASANVYVDHAGDAQTTVVEAVEVVLEEGARAHVVTSQDWGHSVDHVASHTGLVGPNADYRHLEVSLGGRTVYIRPDVRLDHPGGNGELLGVYFVDDGQQIEHRSLIHHNASQTSSDLVYKGALQGDSRATFFGNIRIEAHAKATSSDQTNRNLILTDKARADSIPFLEINNSDVVRCGHHSSVGQVDELQLFYLESRGIDRAEAIRLLVFGFFAEITERIELPGVTDIVLAELEREVSTGVLA